MTDYSINIALKKGKKPYFFQSSQEKIFKGKTVTIIGGGMAGLSAALQAQNMGAKVVILEARDRIGGRVHTVNDVNMGANFIHSPIHNPLNELAKKLNLQKKKDSSSMDFFHMKDNKITRYEKYEGDAETGRYLSPKNVYSIEGELYGEVESIIENLVFFGGFYKQSDWSAQKILNEYLAENDIKLKWHEELYLKSLTHLQSGSELRDISIFSAGEEELAMMSPDTALSQHLHQPYGGYDYAIKDYSKITKLYVDELKKHNVNIHFNHWVKNINYKNDQAIIRCNDGKTYTSDFVISTIPVKALATKGLFTPKLPDHLQTSIKNIHMGKWEKIVFEFDNAYQAPGFLENSYRYHPDLESPEIPRFASITSIIDEQTNKKSFVCILAADQAVKASEIRKEKGEEALKYILQKEFMRVAEAQYKDYYPKEVYDCPNPDNIFMSNWVSSPYSKGSWSALGPYGHGSDRQNFHDNPNNGQLFFAGEFTHLTYPGTVHGALLSGQDSVLRIAQKHFSMNTSRLWGHDRQYSSTQNISIDCNKDYSGHIELKDSVFINSENIGWFPSGHKKSFKTHYDMKMSLAEGKYSYEIFNGDLSLFKDNKLIFKTRDMKQNNGPHAVFNKWALPITYNAKAGVKLLPSLTISTDEEKAARGMYAKLTLSVEALPMRSVDHLVASMK